MRPAAAAPTTAAGSGGASGAPVAAPTPGRGGEGLGAGDARPAPRVNLAVGMRIDASARERTGPGPDLTWRAHPLRQHPARSAVFGVVAAAVLAAAAAVGGPWGLVLAAAFMLMPGAPYLLPTTYRLDAEGVAMHNPFAADRKPWARFAAYREFPDAVQLLFDTSNPRGWLLRGHLLYFAGNRAEVMAAVRRHLAPGTGPGPARMPPPPAGAGLPGTPAR